ncbi:Phage tail fiber protein [Escherichia coli O157:H7 str. 1044]|nr:Phage tail fiber protein [Escherichia coli O157:H7 str. 1044]
MSVVVSGTLKSPDGEAISGANITPDGADSFTGCAQRHQCVGSDP